MADNRTWAAVSALELIVAELEQRRKANPGSFKRDDNAEAGKLADHLAKLSARVRDLLVV